MLTEKKFNLIIVLGIFAFSLIGYVINEPYFITLATKIVILGIAGCALNLILGFGGMVSFGHAMFFGVGSYVAAISAFHSMNGESINLIFFDYSFQYLLFLIHYLEYLKQLALLHVKHYLD